MLVHLKLSLQKLSSDSHQIIAKLSIEQEGRAIKSHNEYVGPDSHVARLEPMLMRGLQQAVRLLQSDKGDNQSNA